MNFLAACSDVVQFFDASAGVAGTGGLARSRTCNVAAAATNACCWNHNGQVIATAGDDGSITVLKLNGTVVPAGVLSAYELPIFGIAFSSKSRKLAAGGQAGVVEIWDLKKGNNRVTLRGHRGPVSCVSFFDKDGCVAAGDQSGRVLLHKLDTPPEEEKSPISLQSSEGHVAVTGLAIFSFGGPTMLASSHADGAARLWDVKRGACARELRGQHRGKISGIALHPFNPSLVITVGSDGIVHYADVRAGAGGRGGGGLRSTEIGVPLTCVSFHHEGLALAVGASDGTVRLVDLRSAKQAGRSENAYAGPAPPAGGVRDVRFQYVPHRGSSNTSASTVSASMDFSSVSAAGSVASSAYRVTSAVNGRHGVDVPANMATGVSTSETRNVSRDQTALSKGGNRHSTEGPSSAPPRKSATASASTAGAAPSSTTPSRQWPGGKGRLPVSALPAASFENGSSQSAQGSDAQRVRSAEGDGLRGAGEWRATEASRRASGSEAGGPEVGVNGINGKGHRHHSGRADDGRTTDTGTDRHFDKNNHNHNHDDSHSLRPVSSGHEPVSSSAIATSRSPSPGTRRVSRSPERNGREDVPVGWDSRRSSELNGSLKAGLHSDYGDGSGRGRDDEQFDSAGDANRRQGGEDGDARFLSQGETAILKKTKGAAKLTVGFRTPTKEPGLPTEAVRRSGDSACGGGGAGVGGGRDGDGAGDGTASSGSVGGFGGGRHVVALERSVLEQVLSSHLSELKEELRKEIRNLHVDVLRQFHSLQDEQAAAMSGFEERLGGLVAENQALRAENDRLRRVY